MHSSLELGSSLREKSPRFVLKYYSVEFKTSKDWFIYEFPLKDLYPLFRGRTLDIPNFDSQKIVELGFLIGNKKAEQFELHIDEIIIE